MRRLRSTSIGSMSAWLPSRRSTEHHSGAFWRRRLGQVRSCSTSGIHGWYFSNGIFLGVTGLRGIRRILLLSSTSVTKRAHQALTGFLKVHVYHFSTLLRLVAAVLPHTVRRRAAMVRGPRQG